MHRGDLCAELEMPNPPSWVKPHKRNEEDKHLGTPFPLREDAGLIAFRRLFAFVGTGEEKAQAELSRNSQQAAPRHAQRKERFPFESMTDCFAVHGRP